MTCCGQFNLYFNKHADAPRVWSIALVGGDWELEVCYITCVDVQVGTIYAPKETADEDDGKPSAYLQATGWLKVTALGSAYITKDKPK